MTSEIHIAPQEWETLTNNQNMWYMRIPTKSCIYLNRDLWLKLPFLLTAYLLVLLVLNWNNSKRQEKKHYILHN